MPRSNQTGEFNSFVGGLITEANPLTFPENASIDEVNFVLNRDGSRERRFGMDYESGLTPYAVAYSTYPLGAPVVSAFEWNNVGGISGKTFIVCQVHDKAYIMDRADESLKSSSYVKSSFNMDTTSPTPARASFASIDGKLVVAYGARTVKVVTYNSLLDTFNSADDRPIKTRDLFGVADIIGGKDLLSPEYINYRPNSTALEHKHMYNLRNQGWAVPRLKWTGNLKIDPVLEFEDSGGDERGLPSNADTPISAIFANTDETDKNSERFNDDSSARLEPSKSRAAAGHYIIDLLDRGQSREVEYFRGCDPVDGLYINANPGATPEYISFRTPTITGYLPVDRSEGGIKVVAEFAGRVFYSGFSSEVFDGDSQSPNLAAYIFYSQQVQHDSQITHCYQEGDPTGTEATDLLETDGGFIRLSGAYNIQQMIDIGPGLMVFAENGIWLIAGSDGGNFSATNQTVYKVTEHGTLSAGSIVVVDGTVIYWADDAIYQVLPDQTGNYSVKEISINIRRYYQSISSDSKARCEGIYDSYSKTVRWLFNNTQETLPTTELVFDIVLGAFYPAIIKEDPVVSKTVCAPIQTSPFNLSTQEYNVIAIIDDVISDVDSVIADTDVVLGGYRSTSYITLVNSEDPTDTSITFSTYNNAEFKDWGTEDAEAYLLTGYIGTGDNSRHKQVPYIFFHFLRTEDGFTDSGDDYTPTNQSSCLVQSQWDWTNSASYGKWGREFQAYRYRRRYVPENVSDTYDYGTTTIVTKNKLRGRGRVVSLLISSEEGKNLKLLGWGMTISVNGNV